MTRCRRRRYNEGPVSGEAALRPRLAEGQPCLVGYAVACVLERKEGEKDDLISLWARI